MCMLSRFSPVRLFAALWTVAHQVPLSIEFSRQENWSGLPCLPPGDLSHPGIKPTSPVTPALQADSLLLSHQGSLFTGLYYHISRIKLMNAQDKNICWTWYTYIVAYFFQDTNKRNAEASLRIYRISELSYKRQWGVWGRALTYIHCVFSHVQLFNHA